MWLLKRSVILIDLYFGLVLDGMVSALIQLNKGTLTVMTV